jgi:predicted small secreted protein
MMNRIGMLALAAATVAALALAGCENTMRGFGQDMQKTGKAIEKATGTGGSSAPPASTPPRTQ